VDVSLHDVPVQAAVGPHAPLEVHAVAGGQVAQGGRGEGGGDDVGRPAAALVRGDGEAAAAHGERAAEGDALEDTRGADPHAGGGGGWGGGRWGRPVRAAGSRGPARGRGGRRAC